MNILIIDNNITPEDWGAGEIRRELQAFTGTTVTTRRGPHDDLPDVQKFDHVIITGSLTRLHDHAPWIDHLKGKISELIDRKIPTLGICYGHQLLAKALCGESAAGKAKIPEIGWIKIQKEEDSRLLEGLPSSFYTFSYHFDAVYDVGPRGKIIAHSDDCSVQAFELRDAPIFGIQFHPEKNLENARKTYENLKKKKQADLYREGNRAKKLYDPQIAKRIFGNFLNSS